MTIERAIQIMSNYDLNFYEVNEKIFDPGEVAEAFDLAIKALEQGMVLDKIRTEIVQMPTISFNANDIYKVDVLAIIDKYKAESEEV